MGFLCWICSLQGFILNQEKAVDEAFFENFKRDPFVGNFFEPITRKQGLAYLKEIQQSYGDLIFMKDQFQENDILGHPRLVYYKPVGYVSPTTLRFMKTAGDLRAYFGSLQGYRILHLGAGYGGLPKVLSCLGGWTSYAIAQEEGTNRLCEKYLSRLGINEVEYLSIRDLGDLSRFDFLIVDGDFLTDSLDLTPLLQVIPRGMILKRGVPDQFMGSIKILKDSGCKGLLRGELYDDENVAHMLFWRPDQEEIPTKFLPEKKIFPSTLRQEGVAITNQVTTNRLGDQLLTYFSAKWLARVGGIPFLRTPFDFADSFQLHEMDPECGKLFRFKELKKISASIQDYQAAQSTLWLLPFSPYSRQEMQSFHGGKDLSKVNWEDPEFKQLIRDSLKPLNPIQTIQPPKSRLSVALHVRRGGAFKADKNQNKVLPLKFASDAFMIRSLKQLVSLFPNQPLYIYLFTDDLAPEKLIEKYSKALSSIDVLWDYEKNSTLTADQRLLSDFLSLQNFDCLVRPCSHFSVIGGKLGRYLLEIGPTHYYLNENREPVYDQIELFFRPSLTREE